MSFYVVIPARYGSSRLAAKPLRAIAGRPMIQHVYERARASRAERVIVATDDARIEAAVKLFGGEVCMTSPQHKSGTDRLQEVAAAYGFGADEIVVNVQGDEPLIPPAVIDQVAKNLAVNPRASVATLSEPIDRRADFFNPNVVKVVRDTDSLALYFSRAPIPWPRDAFAPAEPTREGAMPPEVEAQRHIGIYAYRVALLNRFVGWPMAELEKVECLEQLRILSQGECIHVATAVCAVPGGVDTEADLRRVEKLIA